MFSHIHMLFCQTIVVFGKPSTLVCLIMISHKTPCFFLRLAICWRKGKLYLFVLVSAPCGKKTWNPKVLDYNLVLLLKTQENTNPPASFSYLCAETCGSNATTPRVNHTVINSATQRETNDRSWGRGASTFLQICLPYWKSATYSNRISRVGRNYQPALKCPSHIVPIAKLVGLHIQIWSKTWSWLWLLEICPYLSASNYRWNPLLLSWNVGLNKFMVVLQNPSPQQSDQIFRSTWSQTSKVGPHGRVFCWNCPVRPDWVNVERACY